MRPLYKSIKLYIKDTKTPVYSFIAILPLIILYDVLIIWTRPNYVARAGVWVDNLLSLMRINTIIGKVVFASLAFLIFGLISIKGNNVKIKVEYFPIMLIESIIYAYFFANAVFFIRRSFLLSVFSSQDGLVLSIGAGFYEELVFRLLPIMLLKLFVKDGDKNILYLLLVIIITSVLFSVFHYIGPESYTYESFIFRFISSIILFIIFLTRGFGIAVYTHTIYDLMYFF